MAYPWVGWKAIFLRQLFAFPPLLLVVDEVTEESEVTDWFLILADFGAIFWVVGVSTILLEIWDRTEHGFFSREMA